MTDEPKSSRHWKDSPIWAPPPPLPMDWPCECCKHLEAEIERLKTERVEEISRLQNLNIQHRAENERLRAVLRRTKVWLDSEPHEAMYETYKAVCEVLGQEDKG